jgi:biopolymer transport protein ExbB
MMNALQDLLERGGFLMLPLTLLSIVLYTRCFGLLYTMRRAHRRINTADPGLLQPLDHVRSLRQRLTDTFDQQRFFITAMVAAAPLLGLLGTVVSMIRTFENLVVRAGQGSFDRLVDSISIALITTETGLAIAIPAVIVLHLAQRHLQRSEQSLVQIESTLMEGAS